MSVNEYELVLALTICVIYVNFKSIFIQMKMEVLFVVLNELSVSKVIILPLWLTIAEVLLHTRICSIRLKSFQRNDLFIF